MVFVCAVPVRQPPHYRLRYFSAKGDPKRQNEFQNDKTSFVYGFRPTKTLSLIRIVDLCETNGNSNPLLRTERVFRRSARTQKHTR